MKKEILSSLLSLTIINLFYSLVWENELFPVNPLIALGVAVGLIIIIVISFEFIKSGIKTKLFTALAITIGVINLIILSIDWSHLFQFSQIKLYSAFSIISRIAFGFLFLLLFLYYRLNKHEKYKEDKS